VNPLKKKPERTIKVILEERFVIKTKGLSAGGIDNLFDYDFLSLSTSLNHGGKT